MSNSKVEEVKKHKKHGTSLEETEKIRKEEAKMVKLAHERVFYRELWVNKKIPFAKDWLATHDKEWFKENKDTIDMNQALGNKKGGSKE